MGEEKHRGGRPKKGIRREAATGVRFTWTEYLIVKQKAESAGYKLTQYIRAMALQGHVIARQNGPKKELIPQLIGIASNINQMAKKAHQEGLLNALLFFEKYKAELDEIINQLKYDQ